MENVEKYNSGGGIAQKMFKLDVMTCYEKQLNNAQVHLLTGFGQMECIKQLGARMGGEVRSVQVDFVDSCNHLDEDNPDHDENVLLEARRVKWRTY